MDMGDEKPYGRLDAPKTLFLREGAGTANDKDGNAYELNTTVGGGGTPLIRNQKTGVWWSIGWTELLNIAKEAGIDKNWRPEYGEPGSNTTRKKTRKHGIPRGTH